MKKTSRMIINQMLPNQPSDLLQWSDYITISVDKGRAADVVYLNFRKAFDMVPKKILTLNWRDTDLTNRLLSG